MGWRDVIGVRAILPAPEAAEADAGSHSKLAELPEGWASKASVIGISDALAAVLGLSEPGSLATPGAALRAYEQSAAVAAPVNLIAESFASTPVVLANQDTGDIERKHPILDLLRRPHPSIPGALFWEYVAKMFLVCGEAPIVSIGNRRFGEPSALRPLNPVDLSPVQDPDYGWPKAWHVAGPTLRGTYVAGKANDGATWENGPARTLRVVRAFSTKDTALMRGQSKLYAAASDIRQQIEGARFNVALMRNGARPSLLVSTKAALGRDAFEEFARRLREGFEGTANAGKLMIAQGGEVDVKNFNANVRDMEFAESQTRTAQTIAKVLKVPVVLLNMDAATFSNMETATLALWDDAILPMANYLLGDIGDWLFPAYDLDPAEWRLTVDVTRVGALQARALKVLRDRATSGLESINEIRESMPGRDPKEGGDEILVSSALSPLSVVAAEVDALLAPPDSANPAAPLLPGQDDPEADPDDDPAEE